MLNSPNEYERMADVEESLWWYRCLHRLVLGSLRRFQVPHTARVVDAGCGTGGLLKFLASHDYNNLSGLDLSALAVKYCRKLGFVAQESDIRNIKAMYTPSSIDILVCNDVLCYLNSSEQRQLGGSFFELLSPGGIVLMNLPALKAFSGIHDLSVGIKYRFSKKDLPHIFDPKQFTVKRAVYWPALLSPAIFAVRTLQRRRIRTGNAEIRSDIDLPPDLLNKIFFWLTTLENTLLSHKPFGSSLFVTAQKR